MYREPHPYVCAYVLAGESITRLANEVGVSKYRAGRWLRGDPLTEADVKKLWPVVATVVVSRYRVLVQKLKRKPALRYDKKFRVALNDLDLAHRLCFRQSLLDFFMDAELAGSPSHISPEHLEFYLKLLGKGGGDENA